MNKYSKLLYFIGFSVLVHLIRTNCKIANSKCPEDVWKERHGNRTTEIKFSDKQAMLDTAVIAQTVVRSYLKYEKFHRKLRLDGIFSADRMPLDSQSVLYTMKVLMQQTTCLYDKYKQKQKVTLPSSIENNSCEFQIPKRNHYKGTCCLQFLYEGAEPFPNITLTNFACERIKKRSG